MSIEWFRDLVIVIFGLGATIAVIIFTVMAFMLFFRVKAIMNSAKKITRSVENISQCVEDEILRPIAGVASFVQGLRQAAGIFGMFSRKREEK